MGKKNRVDTIIECDAFMWFADGGVAIMDTSCERPHRSQFEIVCENGVLKVEDLVGGQGRSGNFSAYESPFVGSSSYILGDATGKDEAIRGGGSPDPEFGKRSLATHTVMSAIFESAEKGGIPVGAVKVRVIVFRLLLGRLRLCS